MLSCIVGNSIIILFLSLYFFAAPLVLTVHDLQSDELKSGDIPGFAYRWHRKLSRDMEVWAKERVANKRAAAIDFTDVSGTEWPMFSAVFYLWSTEALQKNWVLRDQRNQIEPLQYSEQAIEALIELITDPKNASWVIRHWGNNYLDQENIFYRMLLIAGLTSYQSLTNNTKFTELLSNQVTSLAKELDESAFGLLDDYPGQCYPIDVLPAIAVIKRADEILGTDHSILIDRAVRGFEDERLDNRTKLPSYIADSKSGLGIGPARGTGISYMLIWSPEIWPEVSKNWYEKYEEFFWQSSSILAGIREFAHGEKFSWYFDIDAGPIINGFGTAASAFGIGATRTHGQMDKAYLLTGEALVLSWPLIDGSLLLPRLLSDLSDAPYVGEAALLFNFTRTPIDSAVYEDGTSLPLSVYMALLFFFLMLMLGLWASWKSFTSKISHLDSEFKFPLAYVQMFVWLALVILGVIFWQYSILVGIVILLSAHFIPRGMNSIDNA